MSNNAKPADAAPPLDPHIIKHYHAHIYYDGRLTREQAARLREQVSAAFPSATLGRWHDAPVGPHPRGSCQLSFSPELMGPVIAWLMLNRGELTVFAHAMTGDALKDHTDHVLWLGASEPLNLAALSRA